MTDNQSAVPVSQRAGLASEIERELGGAPGSPDNRRKMLAEALTVIRDQSSLLDEATSILADTKAEVDALRAENARLREVFPMTDDSEVARIADGLTRAQRAMLEGRIQGLSYRSYRAIGAALAKKGLLRWCLGGFFEDTPLGVRVKAYLQSKGGDA